MADSQASSAFYQGKIACNEGRKYADALAGQGWPLPPGETLDVVFAALGFQHQPQPATTARETDGPYKSQIAELGVACLDTRRLNHPATSRTTASNGPPIETWRYQGLPDDELIATITQHLRIHDAHSPEPAALRTVVLVSASMQYDFNVLDRIGTDFGRLLHVATTMDIPALWAKILPSAAAPESITPAALDGWIQSDPSSSSHRADLGAAAAAEAAYAAHALLRLALRMAENSALALYPRPVEKTKVLACLREAVEVRPMLAGSRAGAEGC